LLVTEVPVHRAGRLVRGALLDSGPRSPLRNCAEAGRSPGFTRSSRRPVRDDFLRRPCRSAPATETIFLSHLAAVPSLCPAPLKGSPRPYRPNVQATATLRDWPDPRGGGSGTPGWAFDHAGSVTSARERPKPTEQAPPATPPDFPYGATKAAGEMLVTLLQNTLHYKKPGLTGSAGLRRCLARFSLLSQTSYASLRPRQHTQGHLSCRA